MKYEIAKTYANERNDTTIYSFSENIYHKPMDSTRIRDTFNREVIYIFNIYIYVINVLWQKTTMQE